MAILPGRSAVLLNAVVLQLGWFAAVLGAARGSSWWGPAFCATAAGLYVLRSTCPARLVLLLVCVTLLGIAGDALLMAMGLLGFPGWDSRLPTPWICGLWPLFATTYDLSFRWLRGRTGLATLLGAVGGPMGYVAADRLGALQLHPDLLPSLFALAVVWAVLLPAGLSLADRILPSSGPPRPLTVPPRGLQR